MSYQILSFSTSPFTQNRIYSLLCDTAADLPASVDGYSVGQGWTAKVIEDGSSYIANAAGSWIQQPSSNTFQNVYTKAEADAIINPLQEASALYDSALKQLINSGSKNRLVLTDTATSSKKGVTITYNNDGTYTIDSAGSPSSGADFFYLARTSENPVFPAGSVISGCSGGSDSTYRLQIAGTTIYQTDAPTTLAADTSGSLIFYFAAGQTFDNMLLSPMVCSSADYSLSPNFEPYCPTLAELYQLVKTYHP